MLKGRFLVLVGLMGLVVVLTANQALADRYESPSFTIDASVGNSFGGGTESANYKMVSSGGESIVGDGAGGSYLLDQGYVAQLTNGFQLEVQAKGLELYLPMDHLYGDTVYDNGKNQRNATKTGVLSEVSGQVGDALNATGAGTEELMIPAADLQPDTLTAEAWVKTSDTSGCIVCYDRKSFGYANGGPFLIDIVGGEVRWAIRTGSQSELKAAGFNDNNWHHIVGTYDHLTGQQNLYVDGQLIDGVSITPSSINYDSSDLNNIMIFNEGGQLSGSIDEVKVYSIVLTPLQVKAAYQAGIQGKDAGLGFPEEIFAGVSQTLEAEAVILTDAPGYSLGISQDGDLSSGSTTIPAVSGSIATPIAWNEGVTKGLGFTIASASATTPDGKWNTGSSYAALPSSATTFYNRTGYSGGSKDVVEIRYRVDVDTAQVAGEYSNEVTYTGTAIP